MFLEYKLIAWRTQNGFSVYLEGTLKNVVHFLGVPRRYTEERGTCSWRTNKKIWGTQNVFGVQLFEVHNTAFWCTSMVHWRRQNTFSEYIFSTPRAEKALSGYNFCTWRTLKPLSEYNFSAWRTKKRSWSTFFNSKTEVHCSSSSPSTLVNGGTVYRVLQLAFGSVLLFLFFSRTLPKVFRDRGPKFLISGFVMVISGSLN